MIVLAQTRKSSGPRFERTDVVLTDDRDRFYAETATKVCSPWNTGGLLAC